jgi:hypothetical protein
VDCDGQIDRVALKTEVDCGVQVRMGCKPAFYTGEKSLRLLVLLRYKTTNGTCTTRIAGINRNHGNALPLGFIFDKRPELIKSPFPESFSLRFGNRLPAVEAFKVFYHDCSAGVFSRRDDFLANTMVCVFLESCLSASKFLQMLRRVFRASFLKSLFNLGGFLSNLVYGFTGKAFSIRSGGDINYSKVNAEKSFRLEFGRLGNIANLKQVENTFAKHKIGFASKGLEHFKLFFTRLERDAHSSRYCPNGYKLFVKLPRKNSAVKSNGAGILENSLRFLVCLVGIGNLCQNTNSHLSRKTKILADLLVKRLVQVVVPKGLILPSIIRNSISGFICRQKRGFKGFELLFGSIQFYLGNQFQVNILKDLRYSTLQSAACQAAIPPLIKIRGFLAEVL